MKAILCPQPFQLELVDRPERIAALATDSARVLKAILRF